MTSKKFMVVCLILLLLPLYVSAALVLLKIPSNQNQMTVWRQLEKLEKPDLSVDTVIIGDSSAGMAIDRAHFDDLAGTNSVMLPLTGSFGIPGQVLMLERAREAYPNLKNALFIVSFGFWQNELSPESYYLLRSGRRDALAGIPEVLRVRQKYLNWLFTPRRYYWYWLNAQMPPYEQGVWDEKTDYLVQGPYQTTEADKAWRVRLSVPDEDYHAPYMERWAGLCARISCVLMGGPAYIGMIEESEAMAAWVGSVPEKYLGNAFEKVMAAPYAVPADMLGDSYNHIASEHRREVTEYYVRLSGLRREEK